MDKEACRTNTDFHDYVVLNRPAVAVFQYLRRGCSFKFVWQAKIAHSFKRFVRVGERCAVMNDWLNILSVSAPFTPQAPGVSLLGSLVF